MRQLQINLYHQNMDRLFEAVRSQVPNYFYDIKKHQVILSDEIHETMGTIRLPLHLSLREDLSILKKDACSLYLSITSGNAAIIVMEGKENVYHTTFSAYMTRRKQGFSQIKYLKKRGKSKAGSRVRLAGTTAFFENINGTLTDLFQEHEVDRIALSCSATLIPYLYQSKVACPFDKKSPKLYKIPLHISQSNFTHLDAAIKKLYAPVLIHEKKYEVKLRSWFKNQLS